MSIETLEQEYIEMSISFQTSIEEEEMKDKRDENSLKEMKNQKIWIDNVIQDIIKHKEL